MTEDEALKRLKALTAHITKIRKTCKSKGLWFSASFDALRPPTDEAQQGPMVTKLFELVDDNKKFLRGK
jgi:hypothetical protein